MYGPISRRYLLRMGLQMGLGLAAAEVLAACGNVRPPAAPATPAAPSQNQNVTQAPTPPSQDREAPKGRKYYIEVWYPYGGAAVQAFLSLFDEFEKQFPDIGIKGVYAANDLSTNQKLFTAIAGGTPPDVAWVDGPQVAGWAHKQALEDLTPFIQKDGLSPDDFWAPSWRQNVYKGKVWAMPYGADANFGFFWNKEAFRKAGLDPEKPPKTIEEVDAYNEKLTKIEGGKILSMGLIPWTVYGNANSMFTWGWVFGGEFYDEKNNKITANHPKNVKALEWMVSYAKKYDITRIASFQQGFGTGEQDPFYTGQIAMAPRGNWEIRSIERFAPKLDYGITFMPQGPGAEPHQAWVGGWCVGIPRGAKHPELAWKFIKWLTASKEGTALVGQRVGIYPGYKHSPYWEQVKADPKRKAFFDIIQETKHQRPVTPVTDFLMGQLDKAVGEALYGQKTPQQALDWVTETVQAELDKALKEK